MSRILPSSLPREISYRQIHMHVFPYDHHAIRDIPSSHPHSKSVPGKSSAFLRQFSAACSPYMYVSERLFGKVYVITKKSKVNQVPGFTAARTEKILEGFYVEFLEGYVWRCVEWWWWNGMYFALRYILCEDERHFGFLGTLKNFQVFGLRGETSSGTSKYRYWNFIYCPKRKFC